MSNVNSRKLIHSEQGKKWLAQFDLLDQEIASLIANILTLVSHNEFERNLISKIENVVDSISGPVALFAMREMCPPRPVLKGKKFPVEVDVAVPFYKQVKECDKGRSVSPVGHTANIGSEGRIVSIIRQFCKRNKKKFLNHPTLERLRKTKCDAILCVDDFIGSGGRAHDFLDALWQERTIVSWHSSKHIVFHVIAYSATEEGVKRTKQHKSSPDVHVYRDCPTFASLPWSKERKESVIKLCEKYGKKANKRRGHLWLGYKKTMAAIVFEHGCPNNVPAILVEKNDKWIGLFPDRVVTSKTLSVFSSEIPKEANLNVLNDIGQKKLSQSPKLIRRGEKGRVFLTILALVAKGKRKKSTLCYSTGLNNDDCDRYLSKCIKWGFVTPQKRITPVGLLELNAVKRIGKVKSELLDKGVDYYYPQQLRKAT